jgi:hypothetical protein
MKKFIILILLFNVCYSANFKSCPKELAKASQTVLQLPEANRLLDQVQQEGGIHLVYDRSSKPYNACWMSPTRTIHVIGKEHRTFASYISSILFEMHNAKQDKKLEYLFQLAERGWITKSEYIESMERIEHQNALETMALIKKGMQLGVYPKDSFWEVPVSFKEHFAIQIEMGHSALHGQTYDALSRKRKGISQRERYLTLKKMLLSSNPHQIHIAKAQVQEEIALQRAIKSDRGLKLLKEVLKDLLYLG